MSLQGVDLSSYQSSLGSVTDLPVDFAIMRATFGTQFVDNQCDRFVQQCIHGNLKWGVYHFITGENGEIDYYLKNIQGYLHHGLICLDWESDNNSQWGNLNYLEDCVKTIQQSTGINPIIYTMASAYNDVQPLASRLNCGLWIAQYANMSLTGQQTNPWNSTKYNMILFQYASTGRLPGYSGNLDLDQCYLTRDQWDEYAMVEKNTSNQSTVKEQEMKTEEELQDLVSVVMKTNISGFPAGYYTLWNQKNASYVVENQYDQQSDNANVDIHQINNTLAQTWYVKENQWNQSYSFQNVGNGQWLTMENAENGGRVSLQPGNGSSSQDWILTASTDSIAQQDANPMVIRSYENPNYALDLTNCTFANGTLLQVWEYSADESQLWVLESACAPNVRQQMTALGKTTSSQFKNGEGFIFQLPDNVVSSIGRTGDFYLTLLPNGGVSWKQLADPHHLTDDIIWRVQKHTDGSVSYQNLMYGTWLTADGNDYQTLMSSLCGADGNGSLSQQWWVMPADSSLFGDFPDASYPDHAYRLSPWWNTWTMFANIGVDCALMALPSRDNYIIMQSSESITESVLNNSNQNASSATSSSSSSDSSTSTTVSNGKKFVPVPLKSNSSETVPSDPTSETNESHATTSTPTPTVKKKEETTMTNSSIDPFEDIEHLLENHETAINNASTRIEKVLQQAEDSTTVNKMITNSATSLRSRCHRGLLNTLYVIGIILFIATAVVMSLTSMHVLPTAVSVDMGILSSLYGVFTHTLGVSYTSFNTLTNNMFTKDE